LGSCAGSGAPGESCLDNCLVYHADCRTLVLVPDSHLADTGYKRYFSPTEILIKHLNTLVGLVHGVKEGSMQWSGNTQKTSSDGPGVWSQGDFFHKARSSPLPVAKSPQVLGYCSPGRENPSTLCPTYRAPFHDYLKHGNE